MILSFLKPLTLTMIGHIDRQFPGVKARYDELSEFAHPNWRGVLGLFSAMEVKTHITQFGRGLGRMPFKEIAVTAFGGYLELFEQVYDWISDTLPSFIEELSRGEISSSGLKT